MICGYQRKKHDNGLLELREVTLALSPHRLRLIAGFLNATADEMEAETKNSSSWHRHLSAWAPEWLQSGLADVIVMAPE